jgi:hypothetical protein
MVVYWISISSQNFPQNNACSKNYAQLQL